MSGAAFPSPTAEMAEINRIQYELEYTEGISQKMRIPEQLKVAPYSSEQHDHLDQDTRHTTMMHVPERIVISGDNDSQFTRPRDLDLIQSTPLESTLSLKTPPRVLTLSEQSHDFLEMERQSSVSQPSEDVRTQSRTRRERSVSENTVVQHNGQLIRNDSAKPSLRGGSNLSIPQHDRLALATLESTQEGGIDDMALVDATSLRRQIVKLNRRLQLLEEENKERTKREMIMYSVTVAFWLINSWVWFRR
ncbi:mitochondrial fission factor homolog B isoform X2 [Triplophysa dalaica]|uniref:mitochondrial fission factor homolog B isoform X2 n=1 Tax=Triplophysa dalaica TaxID=1582913 RepID=UPI0024DFA1EB|nr:mitochondrial fission factor homolog B isoform X2 [Triplophysa dalaica]